MSDEYPDRAVPAPAPDSGSSVLATVVIVNWNGARLLSPRFRNFYMPERDDIFCGFRSCAL